MQQLYPNSRELSMSSAKTITDILSFSELIDAKSFIGNPFTSQPMYVAACAFLMESAYYTSLVESSCSSSSPSSRAGSPPILIATQSGTFAVPSVENSHGSERRSHTKHILLASAAKENYQRCHKALESLETYWEGARYILTVLDQKAKGIPDPLLYTAEEMESAAAGAPVKSLTTPDWLKEDPDTKRSDDPGSSTQKAGTSSERVGSPKIDPSHGEHPSDQCPDVYTDSLRSHWMGPHRSYQLVATKSEPTVPDARSRGFVRSASSDSVQSRLF
jgi:hypothetical protein